ncbi:hypothetical protein [Streptomyces sp. NPDC005374]|uniref:hypothetical protein n=1 Tax=Streptomyces sp. NPDC005374 TaxID=3364713 RepID=UPI00369C1BB5
MGERLKVEVASFALLGSVVLGVTPDCFDAPDVAGRTSTSAGTNAAGSDAPVSPGDGQLLLATDEQYVQTFGADKAAQQGLTYEAVTEVVAQADSAVADNTDKVIAADSAAVAGDSGAAAAEAVSSHWSVVRFAGHDADGRYIPTRQGNRTFGWVHFSGPHNIHTSKVIKVAVSEHPERGSTATRKLYGAVLYDRLGIILARVKVVAQYHWETADHRYKLADHDDKIGVITAYCQGVNRCPDALNRV